ncbi:baramicin A1-like isoform X2 [Drosophila tropicalis]|uniref:baramicin A1-like isoform X2 n=1 Tax=Drosophila tropicalis TaxID=46794 RepID=UPI0035AB6C32
MRSVGFIFILLCAVLCAAQQTYDGRNGPHTFGPPGQQVYIRGQNEGPYQVDGVGGTFQNSPNHGEHTYTDEQGNTYVNRKNANGSGRHSVTGSGFVLQRGQSGIDGRRVYANRPEIGQRRRNSYPVNRRSAGAAFRDRRSPQLKVDRRNPEYLGNSFRYPNGRYNN